MALTSVVYLCFLFFFFFSSRRRHTRLQGDWSSDVCSSDLCPYCRQFHVSVFNELKKNYIDTGKVRFYSRDLPLDQIHPNASRAAQAGRCAADQGQFWSMRDLMGSNPDKLDLESLVAEAGTLKMDTKTFRTCVESQKYKEAVQTDVLDAMKIGAQATPTFVLGKSTPEGVDGELIEGTRPYPDFVRAISKLDSK